MQVAVREMLPTERREHVVTDEVIDGELRPLRLVAIDV